MSAATELRKAADFLNARPWGQGANIDDPGVFCPVLALDAIRPVGRGAYEALRRHLGIRSIPAWNDKPGRTKAEVLAAMRAAADAAEVA